MPCIGYNLHEFLLYLSIDWATDEFHLLKNLYSAAVAAALVAVVGATVDVDYAGVVVEVMASMMKCWSCLR